MYGWERDDESVRHSVARLERTADGWSAHGAETLIGEITMSCVFRVVLDDQWRTRTVHVAVVDDAVIDYVGFARRIGDTAGG